jgi:hypothetical protein
MRFRVLGALVPLLALVVLVGCGSSSQGTTQGTRLTGAQRAGNCLVSALYAIGANPSKEQEEQPSSPEHCTGASVEHKGPEMATATPSCVQAAGNNYVCEVENHGEGGRVLNGRFKVTFDGETITWQYESAGG